MGHASSPWPTARALLVDLYCLLFGVVRLAGRVEHEELRVVIRELRVLDDTAGGRDEIEVRARRQASQTILQLPP